MARNDLAGPYRRKDLSGPVGPELILEELLLRFDLMARESYELRNPEDGKTLSLINRGARLAAVRILLAAAACVEGRADVGKTAGCVNWLHLCATEVGDGAP